MTKKLKPVIPESGEDTLVTYCAVLSFICSLRKKISPVCTVISSAERQTTVLRKYAGSSQNPKRSPKNTNIAMRTYIRMSKEPRYLQTRYEAAPVTMAISPQMI